MDGMALDSLSNVLACVLSTSVTMTFFAKLEDGDTAESVGLVMRAMIRYRLQRGALRETSHIEEEHHSQQRSCDWSNH